ncbi:MAG: hypothetical protein MMC33_006823 [Icmadophila ericetorum]|nr:hypothetical protein [Icmadophila ericetorum]
MRTFWYLTTLSALTISLTLASPTNTLEKRASQCGQYQSESTGSYTLATNGWGWSDATSGSQCSQLNSLSGSTVAWSTSWTWAGGPNNVKSYTNIQSSAFVSKELSAYKTIQTSWSWSYTGTNIVANVAYDTFLGSSSTSTNLFEVMVWLGDYGGCSPLSSNGYPPTPIATPTIDGVAWNLIYGTNGAVKVYSFVAQSKADTSFSGSLLSFYSYLATNYASNGVSESLYLQSVQAGSEVFTGSSAVLTTTGYSLTVS